MSSTSFEQVVEERKSEISFPKMSSVIPAVMVHGRSIMAKVVGTTFENREEVVARLQKGDHIWLEREPSNPFDFNAVKVSRCDGTQFGYLSRHLASAIAPYFDLYGRPVKGRVQFLTGSSFDGYSLGVVVVFKLPKLHANHRQHHHQMNDWDE